MVKSSKKSKVAAAPHNISSRTENAATPATEKPGKSVASKRSTARSAKVTGQAKSARKPANGAADKAPAAGKPRTATSGRKARRTAQFSISHEDIRIRAYFISERRMQSGAAGDSADDWLEAVRQLQEEAGKSA